MTQPSFFRTALLVGGVTLLLSIPYHLQPDNFSVDDGYFYLQIARNIVQGHGATFNGWLPTNGFHPLWMVLCCVCSWISSQSSTLLQLASTLQDVLLACSLIMIAWLAHREHLRGWVVGCALLWLTNDVLGIWRLLETDLALCLQLIVLLVVVSGEDGKSPAYNLKIGLLLGLTLLARLDLVFFAGVVMLYRFFGWRAGGKELQSVSQRGFSLMVQISAMVIIVLPYLVWNVCSFGHLMPISGAIKSVFPHLQHGVVRAMFMPATLPVLIGTLFGGGMLTRRHRDRFETALLLTGVSAGIHLVYSLSFSTAWPWYFTTGYLAFSLAMIWTVNQLRLAKNLMRWAEGTVLGMIVLLFLAIGGMRTRTNLSFTRIVGSHTFHGNANYLEPRRAFAEQLHAMYAPNTRFFLFDSPGSVAYYSGMSITPADGLVADFAWNKDMAREGFVLYAREHAIRYFVCPVLREGQQYNWLFLEGTRSGKVQTMHYVTPLGHKEAGPIHLYDDDLALSTPTIQPGFEYLYPRTGVWRLP